MCLICPQCLVLLVLVFVLIMVFCVFVGIFLEINIFGKLGSKSWFWHSEDTCYSESHFWIRDTPGSQLLIAPHHCLRGLHLFLDLKRKKWREIRFNGKGFIIFKIRIYSCLTDMKFWRKRKLSYIKQKRCP